MDAISLRRIITLHPAARGRAATCYERINEALNGRAICRITHALRTFKEQEKLYEQGRETSGQIVTNAKPGQSFHNYGLALDYALIIDGTVASWDIVKDWDGDKVADWNEVAAIFMAAGWEWGGNWKFKDNPHVQITFGFGWPELLKRYNARRVDKEGYVLLN